MPLRTMCVHSVRALFQRAALLTLLFGGVVSPVLPQNTPAPVASDTATYYANAHAYIDEPLDKLAQHIPELHTLQPASDPQALPAILEGTGKQVDDFFQRAVDLIAHEEIIEQKLDPQESASSTLRVKDSYLILRRGLEFWQHFDEYRMDDKGERLIDVGLNQGYIVTSNFVLNPIFFSTSVQPESAFRYIGDDVVDSHETYVVAFAQKPAEAAVNVAFDAGTFSGSHHLVHMLVQGIAWIDKNNFQIIRMRTDLLAPRPEIHLDGLTTTLYFDEIHLPALPAPLWLPGDVTVSIAFDGRRYRNEHHYSDYQNYSVSVRMAPEEARTPSPLLIPTPDVSPEKSEQMYYTKAHPYFEEPLPDLVKRVPELKKLQPTQDQRDLPLILKNTGANVDDFFRYIVDLIADETIVQRRVNARGGTTASEEFRDNYLILRQHEKNQPLDDIVEYRMDAQGHRLENVGLYRGYLVTFGFALMCNYFSTGFQDESAFRLLGEQKLGAHDAYVVGFAQRPGQTTLFVTMAGVRGTTVHMLMQGIAWVDKSNFQIVQIRTDVLAPRPEIALDTQTTEVTFEKVQLQDVANPLWLPSKVKVYLGFKQIDPDLHHTYEVAFRNEHKYSDYRRYRVSVKMLTTPQ